MLRKKANKIILSVVLGLIVFGGISTHQLKAATNNNTIVSRQEDFKDKFNTMAEGVQESVRVPKKQYLKIAALSVSSITLLEFWGIWDQENEYDTGEQEHEDDSEMHDAE